MARRWVASARTLAGAVALASAAGTLVVAGACLPNLAEFDDEDASPEAAPSFRGCGDGIIASLPDGGDAGESCDPGPDGGGAGCTDCQIACEGKIDPRTGHCYFAVPGAITDYQTAHSLCALKRAHVVTLASSDEVAIASDAGAAQYWIGLAPQPANQGYIPDQREEPGLPFVTNGPCDGCFSVGAAGGVLPLTPDASVNDCIASQDGTWVVVPCTASRPVVCEREPAGVRSLDDCIIGAFCFNVPSTRTKKSYVVLVSASDPDTAAETCRGLDRGSLVVFDTREEREEIAHEIIARYAEVPQQIWIGLAIGDGGLWTWEDGVVASDAGARPLPWGNAQPRSDGGSRAYMNLASGSYDTQLAHTDDSVPRIFICERSAR